jgi:hypothetical protein
MRPLVSILVALMALPVAADDGFSLGLSEIDFSQPTAGSATEDLESMVAEDSPTERAEGLAFQAALEPLDTGEHVQALWDADLGRVHYALAAEHAMLGREGLVNGGRMAGVGLGTAAIGDGDPNGALGLALGRQKWAEMNANQKLQAGVEAGILAALVTFMVSAAD